MLLERLDITDWGIPEAIITDRDPEFLLKLSSTLFKRLKISLLYSTAYHPQTDGVSELTKQTAEIALRFYLHMLDRLAMWLEVLQSIQALLNNSAASGSSLTPNEVTYGFTPNRPLDLLKLPPGIGA